MPSYRLLTGFSTVVETFDVVDDAAAVTLARKLSSKYPTPEAPLKGRPYFRLERREPAGWNHLFAWASGG